MNVPFKYIIFIYSFIFIFSCSSNSNENIKNESPVTPSANESKTDFDITTDYKYEKLDINDIYDGENKEILNKIDFSNIKNIESSLLYVKDGEVYIKRNPYEIYELLLKKGARKTIEDNILFSELTSLIFAG